MLILWLAGIACGISALAFAASWCMWNRRTDGLSKPGGALACRLVQSALCAALWWLAPPVYVGVVVYRWHRSRRQRIEDDAMPMARTYNLSSVLRSHDATIPTHSVHAGSGQMLDVRRGSHATRALR